MDVIWHYYPGVQLVVPDFHAICDRVEDDVSDFRLTQMGWAGFCPVEEAVHGGEGFPGGQPCGRIWPLFGETAVQAECYELRVA
jgi:hypothetical protein